MVQKIKESVREVYARVRRYRKKWKWYQAIAQMRRDQNESVSTKGALTIKS